MKRVVRNERGFTLVELLIVVIILGILAAVAIPQFGDSAEEARVEALNSNLGTLRSAVELYMAHHGEYPGFNKVDGTPSGAGDMGTGAANASVAFVDQLTQYTDEDGLTSATKDAVNFPYGPYLKKNVLPVNPFNSSGLVTTQNAGDLTLAGNAGDNTGYRFDVESGRLIANDGGTTDGVAHEDY